MIPVAKANRDAYRRLAELAAPIFKEHGALKVAECWGDEIPPGKLTSFPLAVKCNDDEAVMFSWILWPSKEARDVGNSKAMADPRMQQADAPVPFDGKRLIMGGFEVMLEA